MAIPKYDEIMLPLLESLSDGRPHTKRELAEKMAEHFGLTAEEREQMLPSTRATYIKHRTGWAAFGLRKAGLAANPVEGTLQITDEGRKFLATNPSGRLTRAVLIQFEPYKQFLAEMKERASLAGKKTAAPGSAATDSVEDDRTTPQERIESAFVELRETLIADLRSKLTSVDPFRFEQVVLDLLVAMGYGGSRREAAEVTQKTGDEGIGRCHQRGPTRLGRDLHPGKALETQRWPARNPKLRWGASGEEGNEGYIYHDEFFSR